MEITKPEVDYPEGTPPKALEITEIWEGDGKVAGRATPSRCTTSESRTPRGRVRRELEPGEPLRFRLGVGQVIQGWDQGVQGMKVGGRRKLVIPPDLGYGSRGAGSSIKPGETLIFVCDLVSA